MAKDKPFKFKAGQIVVDNATKAPYRVERRVGPEPWGEGYLNFYKLLDDKGSIVLETSLRFPTDFECGRKAKLNATVTFGAKKKVAKHG